jgi:hypothetical protein
MGSNENSRVNDQTLLAPISKPLEGVKSTPLSYRLGLLLVAVVLVLLVAIYVGIIGLVGWGVYWHAVNDAGILDGRRGSSGKGALIGYFGPIIVGCILIVFMIKPLFRWQRSDSASLTLSPGEEPRLFAFADQLARHVGAPTPTRIELDCDVNASARFTNGIWSMFNNQLTLRVGLPLVTGLNLRQLTGVLAHEFGHFAQGGGMRLTYVIRVISHWFARVVYERDSWDAALESVARNGGFWAVIFIAWIAKLFLWITRKILWSLMMLGQLVASIMLRQMEFDADTYEARVAGSEAFEQTSRRLKLLGVATDQAYQQLRQSWQEKRLADDLPVLVSRLASTLPADVGKAIDQHVSQSKTKWLDTHPADSERIAAAKRINARGSFTLDLPATVLFRDFAAVSKRVTLSRYFELLGNEVAPGNLFPTDQLISASEQQDQNYNALDRYLQGTAHPARPPGVAALREVTDRDAAVNELLSLRNQLLDVAPAARKALSAIILANRDRTRVAQVRSLRAAGFGKIDAKSFDMKTAGEPELIQIADAARRSTEQADPAVVAAQSVAMRRLCLALSIAAAGEPDPAPPAPDDTDAGDYDLAETPAADSTVELVRLSGLLHGVNNLAGELFQSVDRQEILLIQVKEKDNPQSLIDAILSNSSKMARALQQFREMLPEMPFPYDHAEPDMSIRRYIVPQVPSDTEPYAVFDAARSAGGQYYSLCGRTLSELVARAQALEDEQGLSPMEMPKDEPT